MTGMTQYMNEPVDHEWTSEDVLQEYEKYQDRKKVAAVFKITTKEVGEILKKRGKWYEEVIFCKHS